MFINALTHSRIPGSPRRTLENRLIAKQAVSTSMAGRRCNCSSAATMIPLDSQTVTALKLAVLQCPVSWETANSRT